MKYRNVSILQKYVLKFYEAIFNNSLITDASLCMYDCRQVEHERNENTAVNLCGSKRGHNTMFAIVFHVLDRDTTYTLDPVPPKMIQILFQTKYLTTGQNSYFWFRSFNCSA